MIDVMININTIFSCSNALRWDKRMLKVARTRYKIILIDQIHFLTISVVNWIKLFKYNNLKEIILSSMNYLIAEKRLIIYAYVIMEDHIHLIAKADDLSKEISNLKSFTARKIIDFLKFNNYNGLLIKLADHKLRHRKDRMYQVWQEGYHPQLIQGEQMMIQKIEYIHNNPIRKGLVGESSEWLYSSVANYCGEKGLLDVTTDW
jgi:REP element-mobilizing transposase RayT